MTDKEAQDTLNPAPLAQRLLEKTQAGKISWEPSAEPDAFVATVAGNPFKVFKETLETVDHYGNPDSYTSPAIALLNDKGQSIWVISASDVKGGLYPLYTAVQRVAHHVDERFAAAMAALDKL